MNRMHLNRNFYSTLCLLLLFSAFSSGCRKDKESECPAFKPGWATIPSSEDPAVARVNGVPILKSQLIHHLSEFPDCDNREDSAIGQDESGDESMPEDPGEKCRPSPREALRHLIDMELFAQEAKERGFMDREALLAAKKTAAYKVLEETFEREHTREKVDSSMLLQSYNLNIRHFVRPELRTFSHILVVFPAEDKKRGGKKRKPSGQETESSGKEQESFARKLSDEIHEKGLELQKSGELDRKTFFEMGAKFQDKTKEFKVRAERGTAAKEQLVQEFAHLLFGMEKTETIAGPVKTRFGFHVIFLEEIQPAIDIPFEEARETLLERVFPEYRQRAFGRYLKKLEKSCPVKLHIENLPHARSSCPEKRGPEGETEKDHGI